MSGASLERAGTGRGGEGGRKVSRGASSPGRAGADKPQVLALRGSREVSRSTTLPVRSGASAGKSLRAAEKL